MKRLLLLTLTFVLSASFALCACAPKPVPAATEEPEPVETTPDPELPTFDYDEAKHVLIITGKGNYDKMTMPEDVTKSVLVIVNDDEFTMNVKPSILRYFYFDLVKDFPAYIERTEKSIAFLKDYLSENAGELIDEALLELPVEINITEDYSFRVKEDRIVINDYSMGYYRELYYLLAMMNARPLGWEQFGFAWYVGTFLNPYNESIQADYSGVDAPYIKLGANAGVNFYEMSCDDMRKLYDAMSRVGLEKGLNHWGSMTASMPVSSQPECNRAAADDPCGGDRKMSPCMAASFAAWLARSNGSEAMIDFCFGEKTFEEAFGTDFDSSFEAWKTWLIDEYPME